MELRRINPIEVNKSITLLPDRVFGYCYAHSLTYNVSALKNPNNDLSCLVIEKRNIVDTEKRYFFEIRKYSQTDIRLIGYISDEAQLTFTEKGGFMENEILVFPFIYEQFRNCLEIQLCNHLYKIKDRKVEYDEMEISIIEISKFIPDIETKKVQVVDIKKEINTTESSLWTTAKAFINHPALMWLILAVIIYFIYLLTGINLKDFSL